MAEKSSEGARLERGSNGGEGMLYSDEELEGHLREK